MKKLIILLLAAAAMLTACQNQSDRSPTDMADGTEHATEESIKGRIVYDYFFETGIQNIVMVKDNEPEIFFSKEQIAEFVIILKEVDINREALASYLYEQLFEYNITMSDGSKKIMKASWSYIMIDDKCFKAADEPCKKLNEFSNQVIIDAEDDMEKAKPFEELTIDDVQEVRMIGEPDIDILLSGEQIVQLVTLLHGIETVREVEPQILMGMSFQFQLTMSDGQVIIFQELNPYFIIDGVWYKVAYEPREELSQFAIKISGLEF